MQKPDEIHGITVRRYVPEDYPFLGAMLVAAVCWREETPTRSLDELLSAKPRLQRYIQGWGRDGDTALVAHIDGCRLGAAWYRLFPEDEPGYGYVSASTPEISIAVAPGSRRRGVGSVLLKALLRCAHREGVAALSLSVSKMNPARLLYERGGFAPVRDDGDAWVMCVRVCPEVEQGAVLYNDGVRR